MSATCQHCSTKTSSSPDVARRDGWIIWEGDLIGGQHVTRVFCPDCAGRTEANEVGEGRGYDADCLTCMESASDELDPDERKAGLTKAEAEEWAEEHRCERDIHVTGPKRAGQVA